MSDTARVTSIQSIQDFREVLCLFAEEARNALIAADMEARRTLNFVLNDRLAYWKSEIKRRTEKANQARIEMHRKKLVQANSEAKGLSEAREALRLALARLEEAEQKVRTIAKWKPILEHAMTEYRAQSQPLSDTLQGELPHALGLLEKMVAALEAYLALAPPTAPSAAEMGGS
ncbi:MAG TPA: hypothetical protein VG406_29300 [Isosphaeraceae bacterium]|jgi:hypothetical protein|nr:hypothetical protein [Isosphaeraceae bacterium]